MRESRITFRLSDISAGKASTLAAGRSTGSATAIDLARTPCSMPSTPSTEKSVVLVRILDQIDCKWCFNAFCLFLAAKSELIKSKLPNSVLSKIWKLSDVDCDGFLDVEEFALAMHLINVKIDGNELPNILPEHLIPPSQRK